MQPYRPDIDGLRGLAVMAVVGFHAFPTLVPGGFVGVDVFFVISGYLITCDIIERQGAGTFWLTDFYVRRIRRIFPALLLVLTTTAAIGFTVLFEDELVALMRHTAASALFMQNFHLLQQDGYFAADSQLMPLLHLWSLSVEEQFYLLWPLALVACPAGLRLHMTFVCMAASFGLVVWQGEAGYYLPQTRFWQIQAGAALAIGGWRRDSLGTQGLILCVAAALLCSKFMGLGLTTTVATVAAASAVAGRSRFLEVRWLVAIGLVSYPLYLWHWPLLSFLRITGHTGSLETVAAMALSVVMAVLTYLWIEQPVRSTLRRRIALALAAGMAVVSVSALVIIPAIPGMVLSRTDKVKDLELVQPTGGACDERLKGPRQECVSDGRQFLLLGDSHAEALFNGLRQHQPGKWSVIIRHGCAPADVPGIQGRKCSSIIELLSAVAASEYETVVLAFRETYPGLPAALGTTVRALEGKRIVILTSVPDLSFSPRDCITRPLGNKFDCAFLRSEVQNRQASMRAAMAASGVEVVDVLDALCDGPLCRVDRGDMLMFRDRDHLSVRGAVTVGKLVVDAVNGGN